MSSSLFPADSGREKAIFRRGVIFRLKDRERRMGDLATDGGKVGFFGDIYGVTLVWIGLLNATVLRWGSDIPGPSLIAPGYGFG